MPLSTVFSKLEKKKKNMPFNLQSTGFKATSIARKFYRIIWTNNAKRQSPLQLTFSCHPAFHARIDF
jgi:hypothetical protein